MSKTVTLFSQPYLDTKHNCYKNIVTINTIPYGPLSNFVRRVKLKNLSPFNNIINDYTCNNYNNCKYALSSMNTFNVNCNKFNDCCELMTAEQIPNLISFLLSNGYSVDTSITKMFNDGPISLSPWDTSKLICFITYNK